MTEIKVLKRNGETVDFNIAKIENAILYAMDDIIGYEDKELVFEIIENVQEQIEDRRRNYSSRRNTGDSSGRIIFSRQKIRKSL